MRYFAFLRAVNVGGRTLLMKDLKELCASLGFDGVRTLLQSGNVAFDAKRKPSETQIAEAIRASSGLETKVMIRSEDEFRRVIANNPFTPIRNPSLLLVVFLEAEPKGALTYSGPEKFQVVGRELYVDYVNGVGRSKLTITRIERSLGVAGTARNWNTVTKMLEL